MKKVTYNIIPQGLFKGRNFITPTVLGYWNHNDIYAELSTGRDFNDNVVFGCTFEKLDGDKVVSLHDDSELLYDTERFKAVEYIEEKIKLL